MEKNHSDMKVRYSIGTKLIAISSAIVVSALVFVTFLVSYFITLDIRRNAESNNLALNSRTAADCQNRIKNAISSVDMMIDLCMAAEGNETEIRSITELFFDRNKEIAAVYIPETQSLFYSQMFVVSHEMDFSMISDYFEQNKKGFEQSSLGTVFLKNASPFFEVPLMAIFTPTARRGKTKSIGILYSSEALFESFSEGSINQSFFVNSDGETLVHSTMEMMMEGKDMSLTPIVRQMKKSKLNNMQTTYTDETGEEYIGAFRKLDGAEGAVLTEVKTGIVLEGVRATTRRNVYITMAILFLTILFIYFFAKSMSRPLKQLSAVVNEINNGNFNTPLFSELKTKSQDEIGVLVKSTKNEREILNMFTKLTNRGVTKAIITKKIDFEPHLKDITIFFSDIRGFTAISDGFKNRFGEKSAAEIIGFLNDYMSRMVTCILRTGGIVDKFEGDAIMACWGVLRNESLDWELLPDGSAEKEAAFKKHQKAIRDDALSAITSCIAMRYSLSKYNKDARAFTNAHANDPLSKYKPEIRIGSGLNSGRATVGFMGSYDKMEFTSIGDAVNLASRTESSNKPCGTDILITEDTRALLIDYIRCEENNYTIKKENASREIIVEQIPVEFEVKGKGKQHFYAVVNIPHFNVQSFFGGKDPMFEIDEECARTVGPKGPKTIAELRKILGIPQPDFEKVNLNAEENKIQVAKN
ncbi:MAG: adenylate/guanylate cyclase domain-containing protein [Treponema sp.]|nr:adenylate/guanylate cyclase domain-containing protein [Treponema sp.]